MPEGKSLRRDFTLRAFIDWVIGEEHIIRFREDLKWLIYENNSKFNNWDEQNRVLKRQAYEGFQTARKTQWNKYAMGLGILGVIFGVIGPLGAVLSIGSLLITMFSGLHKISVDFLVFDRPYREYRNRRLKFMSAWNRGVMTSWKAVMILPLGMLVRYTPEKYKIGLWVLDEMLADKYS